MQIFDCGPLLNLLSTYVVGFTLPDGRNHYDYIGTGTLVEITGKLGILTAKHVLDVLPTEGEARIALFRNRNIGDFAMLDLAHTTRVSLNDADVGFLTLPAPLSTTLNAYKSFKPLITDAVHTPELPRLAVLLGVPDEWTTNEIVLGGHRRQFHLLGTKGTIIEKRQQGSHDIFTLRPDLADPYAAPKSYGGVSGGGVWLAFISEDGRDVADRRLIGVAYLEREIPGEGLVIDCYGPETIYRDLVNAVAEQAAQVQ